MRRPINYYLAAILLASALLSTGASAEIYKWTDADGNVHFGDKPRNQAQAESAETVEIRDDYQPAERTTEDQEKMLREQQIKRQRAEIAQREKEAAVEDQQRKREEQAARCAPYDELIHRLSYKSGQSTRYYVKGEDGKSVSTREQQEILKKVEKEKAAAGC